MAAQQHNLTVAHKPTLGMPLLALRWSKAAMLTVEEST